MAQTNTDTPHTNVSLEAPHIQRTSAKSGANFLADHAGASV